jgi:hypothetical protein
LRKSNTVEKKQSILDYVLTKINDWIVELQKFTNIWVWQVTEDIHAEDVASVLPPATSKEESKEGQPDTPTIHLDEQPQAHELTPTQRVWSLSLRVWWYILTIIVLFFVVFVWRGF